MDSLLLLIFSFFGIILILLFHFINKILLSYFTLFINEARPLRTCCITNYNLYQNVAWYHLYPRTHELLIHKFLVRMNVSFLGGVCANNFVLLFSDRNYYAHGMLKISDGMCCKDVARDRRNSPLKFSCREFIPITQKNTISIGWADCGTILTFA